MSVEAGVERDLKQLPEDLRESGLAQGALAVARSMDKFQTSPAEMASCLRALSVTLDRLRDLAPPEDEKDGIERQREKLQNRRARVAKNPGRALRRFEPETRQ